MSADELERLWTIVDRLGQEVRELRRWIRVGILGGTGINMAF